MHFIILMGYKRHNGIYNIYIYNIYLYMGISLLLDKAVSETFFSMRHLWESNPRSRFHFGAIRGPPCGHGHHPATLLPSCYPPVIKHG
jgi:hypothetical protein